MEIEKKNYYKEQKKQTKMLAKLYEIKYYDLETIN